MTNEQNGVSNMVIRPFTFRYFFFGLVGVFSTWFCNLQDQRIQQMFTKPSVLLDPRYPMRVVGEFLREQLSNSTTTAVLGTFGLAVGSIIIINCRITPGSMGRRLGFHYLGLLVAIALAFPLQCGLYEHPKEAPADAALTFLSVFVTAGIGTYGIFVQKSDEFLSFWYLALTAVVPLIYEPCIFKYAAQAKSGSSYNVLAVISFAAQVSFWLPVLLGTASFRPFATWFTCSIFWDLVVCCICGATWVLQYTGSFILALTTLVSPGTGILLAMAKMSQPSAKVEEKKE
jgi:hypothetical protein